MFKSVVWFPLHRNPAYTRCYLCTREYNVWHHPKLSILLMFGVQKHIVWCGSRLKVSTGYSSGIVLGKLFVKYNTKCLRIFKWICIKFQSMKKHGKLFRSYRQNRQVFWVLTHRIASIRFWGITMDEGINLPNEYERWDDSECKRTPRWGPLITFSYLRSRCLHAVM